MRNPIRRNRKIGKTQGGRVKNGRAYEKWSRSGFLNNIFAQISEQQENWQLYSQNPSRDYFHPCEGHEYINVLERLPIELTDNLSAIVLPRISKYDEKYGVEAKRRYFCILMNPFPKTMEMTWEHRPTKATYKHYEPWCDNWRQTSGRFNLVWKLSELKKYYLYHVFLHELGHINQPWFHSLNRREEFAENFALEWARALDEM